MKTALVLVVLVAAGALVTGAPSGLEERAVRQRRATCDLLSIFNVNHAACAVHCIAMQRGFRGGYCDKGVCHCRK